MFNTQWMRRAAATACSGALLASGVGALAQDRDVRVLEVVLQEAPAEGGGQGGVEKTRTLAVKVSDYWLGLECYPADATLRAQLSLPPEQGLVVEQIVPDSPAAKALQQHDVLVKAGDKPLKTLPDLMEAVSVAKDQELALEVVRGGKVISVVLTPAKRPDAGKFRARFEDRDMGQLRGWIESMRKGEQPGALSYRMVGPGVMLPGGPGLPKDLSVSITRQGSEPAKITVKRGDQTWEITDQKLAELPEDIRPHVERMLGRGLPLARRDVAPATPLAVPPVPAVPGVPVAEPRGRVEVRRLEGRVEDRMEKQLKELNEQLEKLRRQVEEMQRGLPKAGNPGDASKA